MGLGHELRGGVLGREQERSVEPAQREVERDPTNGGERSGRSGTVGPVGDGPTSRERSGQPASARRATKTGISRVVFSWYSA